VHKYYTLCTAQSNSLNVPPYPQDSHHCSDVVVYWRSGNKHNKMINNVLSTYQSPLLLEINLGMFLFLHTDWGHLHNDYKMLVAVIFSTG